MRQLCLGLDVSELRMGWGLADLETAAPVMCGVADIAPRDVSPVHIEAPMRIRSALGQIGVIPLAEWGDEIAAVYIEAPHVGVNRAGAMRHAMTIGSVWQAVSRRWPDAVIAFVQPSEWKSRVGVEPEPKGLTRSGLALAAVDFAAIGAPDMAIPDGWADQILKAPKPFVMVRALELGFLPNGSQDASDAGLIAVAGALINAEIVQAAGA